MQLHQLKRKTKLKRSAQVGRGGKRGKTSGRGTKGQKARSGHKIRPEFRDVIKRIPKLRGRGKNSLKSIQGRALVVNLFDIEKAFKAGDEVNPQTLLEKGLVEKRNEKMREIKILSLGEIGKKVVVSGCAISENARKKIEAAGGSII